MTRFAWCLGVCLTACGGSGTPAAAPEGAEEAPPVESAGDSASSSEPASDSTPSRAEAPEASGEATKEDVQAVLQLVIEDQELTPFLHLEQPDRFPLRIAGDLPPGLELTKATKPVEIVDAAESKKKPVIVFTEIDVRPTRATVRYRYDIEGVKGACTLEKRDGHWVLAKSRITER